MPNITPTLIPAYVPPPADAIKMELEARAWSIHDFAQHSQLSEEELDDILAARQALDALSAKKIARAFGSSSQLWLGLEQNYQAYRQRQQEVKSHNIQDIAHYFLYLDAQDDSADGISNLKLQKLLYFAYSRFLTLFDKALFDEPIEAWQHGPVIPSLYHHYKCYGKNMIPFYAEDASVVQGFSSQERTFLEQIYRDYSQYSAWKLAALSHEEKPWQEAQQQADKVISLASMIAAYSLTNSTI